MPFSEQFCVADSSGAASLYKLVRGREGMGFGDVKMMFMVGTSSAFVERCSRSSLELFSGPSSE
jgi:hypothetical protein